MKAVVLCAGFGTRLGPLTRNCPKPMLAVGGLPIVSHTLALLHRYGFSDIAINLHYRADQITDYLGDGRQFGVRLHYSHEADRPLGTAGALVPLFDWLKDEASVMVVYGDVVTDQDLSHLVRKHNNSAAFATLLVHRRERSNSILEIDTNGRIVFFVERPDAGQRELDSRHPAHRWVNSGVQMLSRRALEVIAATSASDLPRDVYVPLAPIETLAAVPLSGCRFAVDSARRLRRADAAIRSGRMTSYAIEPFEKAMNVS